MTNKNTSTIWVCMHCMKWNVDRHQLMDVSCFLNAGEFTRDKIIFDGDTIIEIRLQDDT